MESTTKDNLEVEKLRLEIDGLRFGWRRTLITALLTVATSLVSAAITLGIYFYGVHNQRLIDAANRAAAAQDTLDRTFIAARNNLSAPNAATRIHAAYDLAKYIHTSGGTVGRRSYAEQAISVLVEQLDDEKDASVLRAISTVLGNAGPMALLPTADENRVASQKLGRAYGKYAVFAYHKQFEDAENCKGAALDDDVSDAVFMLVNTKSASQQYLYVGCLMTNTALQPSFYSGASEARNSAEPLARDRLISDVKDTARQVIASGNAVEAILRNSAAPLPRADLHNTVLIAADFSGLHLDRMIFYKAYVDGRADNVSFKGADLRQVSFENFALSNADLRGANVDCALFDYVATGNNAQSPPSLNFNDTRWWKSAFSHGSSLVQPWWLYNGHNAPANFQVDRCALDFVKPASYVTSRKP